MFAVLTSLLLVFCVSVSSINPDTVVGCGGFIHWKDNHSRQRLDFGKLKVNLFSEVTNTLKDVGGILPNGAYSLPLYDEGLYRIKLSTPPGWLVSPSNGHILEFRANSKVCATDFNFEVYGFTVTGQVTTSGMRSGPSGLTVHLSDENTDTVVVQNFTEPLGFFSLSPVTSGQYLLTVSNGESYDKNHIRAQLSVTVTSDSVHLMEPILLLGHFLRGHVLGFNNQPLYKAQIFIFLKIHKADSNFNGTISSVTIPSSVSDVISKLNTSLQPIHVTETDEDGYFTFDRLPGGDYILVPYYDDGSVIFSFHSTHYQVTMEHSDIDLCVNTFVLKSFQLQPGRVVWFDGQPIASAKLTLTSGVEVMTDSHGYYQIGHLVPGSYEIRIDVKDAVFGSTVIKFSPGMGKLPEFSPSKVAVCGSLVTNYYLTGKLTALIIIRDEKLQNEVDRIPTYFEDNRLTFCVNLPPGLYSLIPDAKVLNTNGQWEIARFAPTVLKIKLAGPPIHDLLFTQFRAELRGRLQCIDACSHTKFLFIQLNSTTSGQSVLVPITVDEADPHIAFFTAVNVLPGNYLISILHKLPSSNEVHPVDGWCWSTGENHSNLKSIINPLPTRSLYVGVQDLNFDTESNLAFKQIGYLVHVRVNLPRHSSVLDSTLLRTVASVKHNNQTTYEIHAWNITDSSNSICLPSNKLMYRFSVFNRCAHFKPLNTISPARDCGPSHTQSAVLHANPDKLPITVHFKLSDNVSRFSRDLIDFLKPNISLETRQLSPNDQKPQKSEIISVNWPTIAAGEKQELLSVDINLWTDLDKHVELYPHFSVLQQQPSLFNIVISPPKHDVKLGSNSETTDSFALRNVTPASPLSDKVDFSLLKEPDSSCTKLSKLQNMEFTIAVTINLHGKIDPPVDKATVHLYRKLYTVKQQCTADADHKSMVFVSPHSVTDSSKTDPINQQCTELVSTVESNNQGLFTFSSIDIFTSVGDDVPSKPLQELIKFYHLNVSKPGYKFDISSRTDSSYNWLVESSRLSLVEVKVVLDSDSNKPLPGVLISIIGEGHRFNQLTQADGYVRFIGLTPGQYYLQPMMKEYSFTSIATDPSGQAVLVQVVEGKSVLLKLFAHRVTFSVSGIVTSFSGYPEANVLVEAQWLPSSAIGETFIQLDQTGNISCQLGLHQMNRVPLEEAITDVNGHFRIRGLSPGCTYCIKLGRPKSACKQVAGRLHPIEDSPVKSCSIKHAFPEAINLRMSDTDFTGLKFYGLGELFMSILTVSVDTSDELLPTLKLTVFPVGHPDLVVSRHDFGSDSLLFSLSGEKLGALVGIDHIIRLTSDLKPGLYWYSEAQEIRFKPKLDHNEHHVFIFRPVLKTFVFD